MGRVVTLGLAILIVLGAAVFASRGEWPYQRLPDVPTPPPIRTWEAADTLHRGESLGDLFARHGIGAPDLPRLVELFGIDPRRLQAGLVFQFGYRETAPGAAHVTLRTQDDLEVRAVRELDNWAAEHRPIRWFTRPIRLEGTIESSLYDAIADAHSSEPLTDEERVRLAWDLADVFAWQIDFSREIQPNDRFAIVLEREASERGEVRVGRILASELSVASRRFTAFRFDSDLGSQFFDEEGTSLRRAFLKAPVAFRRIASRFSRSRLHPILGVRRRHSGVDYSATAGTPVLASADGQVVTAGWSGGYGRLVELRHRGGITTRYAHLRSFARGVRAGARVRQGDVIGFVGATGLATAPHLHYEFRQNGAARDPSRVDLGSGDPVPPALLAAFQAERRRLEALLAAGPATATTVGLDTD